MQTFIIAKVKYSSNWLIDLQFAKVSSRECVQALAHDATI